MLIATMITGRSHFRSRFGRRLTGQRVDRPPRSKIVQPAPDQLPNNLNCTPVFLFLLHLNNLLYILRLVLLNHKTTSDHPTNEQVTQDPLLLGVCQLGTMLPFNQSGSPIPIPQLKQVKEPAYHPALLQSQILLQQMSTSHKQSKMERTCSIGP